MRCLRVGSDATVPELRGLQPRVRLRGGAARAHPPLLLSDAISTNLLPPALTETQHVDYRSRDRAAGLKLARAIGSLPPAGPLPDPLPAPPDVPASYLVAWPCRRPSPR